MKLLHTADWHLGKRLDHISRLAEQQAVLDEICRIAEAERVDAVLLAGDIFDHINPSVESIELLYKSLKRLTDNGQRPVIGIAGNHDSADRIEAPDPLARECGIILCGYPDSEVPHFKLDSGLAVLRSAPGFLELRLPRQDSPLRLLLTPYANELRLKKYLGADDKEVGLRDVLQARWTDLAETYCDAQGVNVLMTHLFVVRKGEVAEAEPEDEKPILTVGGASEIFTSNFPPQLQYVALGHLHRPFSVSEKPFPVVYAGSPLSYSMSEAEQEKSVVIIEAEAGQTATHRRVALQAGKSLIRRSFSNLREAIDWLEQHQEALVEITLISDHYLTADDRKLLHQAHAGIVAIIPKIVGLKARDEAHSTVDLSRNIEELFVDFFQHRQDGQKPDERMLRLFREVLAEDDS